MKNRYALAAAAALTTIWIVQSLHMMEHVAQVIQKFVLGQPEAHRLLGTIFDFEWVHFVYNTSLEVALVFIFIWYRRAGNQQLPLSLRLALWVQGYHVVEHLVKMFQYYAGGAATAKGILGFVFPVVWLHFSINLFVLALIFVLIVGDWEIIDSYGYRSRLEPVVPRAVGGR